MPDQLQEMFRRVVEEEIRRTDVTEWMRSHRTELNALLGKGEMDWKAATRHLHAAGLRDAKGRRLIAEAVQEAWRRVQSGRRERTKRRT